jgi:hypothetical protein
MSPKLANYGWPASAALLALAAGLLLLFVVPDSNEQRKVSPTASAKVSEICGKLPLAFESNHGQAANQVKFLTRGPEYHLFLTPSEAVLTLHSKRPLSDKPASPILSKRSDAEIPQAIAKILRMQFIGANANPKIIGENELPGKVNYFIGNNPSQWQTDIPTYARVRYPRMYPGVDLVYYGDGRRLEFDFEVHPDGRADAVKLRLVGATGLETDASGDLIIGIESAQLRMKKPIVYQMNNGVREEIQAAYLLEGDLLTFQIAGYDTTRPLIIDPILVYSRILGGSGDDNGVGIAIDGAGAAYLAGQTNSGNYPISGPFQGTYRGNADAFVTKLNPAGSAVEFRRDRDGLRLCHRGGRRWSSLCDRVDRFFKFSGKKCHSRQIRRWGKRRVPRQTQPIRVRSGIFHLYRRKRRGNMLRHCHRFSAFYLSNRGYQFYKLPYSESIPDCLQGWRFGCICDEG